MTEQSKSINTPRSRLPINEETVKLWDLDSKNNSMPETKVINQSSKTEDKSTNTEHKEREYISTGSNCEVKVEEIDPKDIVLKTSRERQSIYKYEMARKAITNSIKEKFDTANKLKSQSCAGDLKVGNRKDVQTINISNADVEDTSNSNVNRGEESQAKSVFSGGTDTDGFCKPEADGVSHASRLQMGPGGELAQCKLARYSSAAGAVGGLRRLLDEEMPLPTRESLSTPRSARAPLGRRPSTLPHQRIKKELKEKSPDSPPEMDSPVGTMGSDLRRQNEELRARLAGESADHKRRLDAYRRAQQGQAALVSRLQAKVLQYKQRCSELETQMLDTIPRSESQPSYRQTSAIALPAPAPDRKEERIGDLDTALRRIEEEKRKCEKLVSQNNLLREQLEESHQLNEALTNDLQKLTNDWETLRDEMTIKEDEWKDEEQAFNDYYSSEHNRLLNLWREVVSVKRFFSETQTTTERDLYKVKNDIDSAARDLMGTLSGFAINAFAQGTKLEPTQLNQSNRPHQLHQPGAPTALESLRADLHTTTLQRDSAQSELKERDARIQCLLGELQGLEERVERAEAECSEAGAARAALEHVARALIHDADEHAPGPLSAGGAPRAPGACAAFAESAVSALQAALHKYQIQIHELQVKLQNTREQLLTSRKNCEVADSNIASLEDKVRDLQGKLDQSNADLNQLVQEKESMLKTIESLRSEKNNLERNRLEINAMVESLSSDYEKLQKINSRLEKNIEALENEKRTLNSEVDHLRREGANREAVLRSEEERSSRLRAELVSVGEELNKVSLARDLLEQQRIEGEELVSQLEKNRSELEIELERTILERGDLQDLADKLQALVRNLETDKKKLLEDVKQLEDERSSLLSQSSELQSDLNSLRKELLAAEQNRMELEADKATLHEKIKFQEGEREKVEMELRQVTRDRGELSSQLSAACRGREAAAEELARLQQRLEQAADTQGRLNRALDERARDAQDRQMAMDNLEKDKQQLAEQLAGARSEKDALEAALFDTSSLLEDALAARDALARDLHDARVHAENCKGQIARLTKDLENSEKKLRETRNSMAQSSGKKEAEYQQVITNLNRTTTENITKLKEEKELIRHSLEQKLSQSIASLTSEKEAFEASAREREKKLLAARDQLILQHDEALLRAENDKQQALLMAHQEHQALMERLEEAKRVLYCEQNKLERVKRDAQARSEQDRNLANQLKDDLAAMKTKLEEAKASAEDECARYENRIKELHLEKEALGRECAETRAALALAEDKHDAAYTQLHDTLRKLKDLENEADSLRKELTDTRRQLSISSAERDKYNSACKELREHVKRSEHERREAARARDEAYQRITSLEESRTTLELELSRVQSLLKESESGGEHTERALKATEAQLKRERAALEQAHHDVKELQSRLQNESEERERVSGECAASRRQGAELEAALQAARGDLAAARARAAALHDAARDKDQELVLRLEDCRSKERRLEELKHNLEVCLADATQQIQELKSRVAGGEGRCRAVEASLAQSEAGRREAEARLSSVAHCLRRVCGVQHDGSLQPAPRRRLASPARRYSPHRGRDHSEDRNDIVDVDPEMIKKGLRNLMHEVCQIEREKDDFKAQVAVLKKQLKDSSEQQGKGEGQLQTLGANVRALGEERARLQAGLAQREAQIGALNESVQSKTVEVSTLRDKITSLEATLSSLTEEKLQTGNKSENLRVQLAERVQEIGQLREALAAAEARASRLDVRRAQLEGDVQRAAAAARERDAALKKLQERIEGYTRTIASLEDRCTSLKGTVEQLSAALQKAAAAESDLRAELAKTHRLLHDARTNENNALDKLRQLQKSIANCENERRVLSEKLESAKAALGELKRVNGTLEDQTHRLTNQLAHVEAQRVDLESQLRASSWEGWEGREVWEGREGGEDRRLLELQRDRADLAARNQALQETVRLMEARRLRPTKDARRTNYLSSDQDSGADSIKDIRLNKETPCKDKSFSDLSMLELENRELKMKIRRLEKELADKDSELLAARKRYIADLSSNNRQDTDQYRQDALQSERLLEAREASHRQQILRLENQLSQVRAQLSGEIRRRQSYVARSGRAARDVQRLRTALGDSLRTVAQDPALDSYKLEHEARKLDNTLTQSLPPLNDSFESSK